MTSHEFTTSQAIWWVDVFSWMARSISPQLGHDWLDVVRLVGLDLTSMAGWLGDGPKLEAESNGFSQPWRVLFRAQWSRGNHTVLPAWKMYKKSNCLEIEMSPRNENGRKMLWRLRETDNLTAYLEWFLDWKHVNMPSNRSAYIMRWL